MKDFEIGVLLLAFAGGLAVVAGCSSGGVPAAPVGGTIPAAVLTPSSAPT